MTTRKPTPLQQAQARITELEKKLETESMYLKWSRDTAAEAQKELEQAHAIIDVLPGALPREKRDHGNHALSVRIASWLAVAK